jgi:hypothetical protein
VKTIKAIKVRIIYNSKLLWFFPRRIDGVTLGRTIHFRGENVDRNLINHELIHVCQFEDRGQELGGSRLSAIMSFLGHYLFPLNQKYRDKPEEREAYRHEHNPDYIVTRWPGYVLLIKDSPGGDTRSVGWYLNAVRR